MITTHKDQNLKKGADLLALTGIFLMMVGFLFNRVVCNTGSLLIGIYTLLHIQKAVWIFRQPWMITFILLAMVTVVSDILTEGTTFYMERGVMKMILILIPVFFFVWNPDKKRTNILHHLILVGMLISTGYSLYHYIVHFEDMAATYKVSKVMPTLSLGDHIRISWVTGISCIIALYQYVHATNSVHRWLYLLYILIQMVFLHLLGAKTGLLSLYLSIVVYSAYTLANNQKWLLTIIIGVLLLALTVAYKTIPSLEQRFNFVKYDFEHYSRGEYKEGLSDAVRFYSLQAGKSIIVENPIFGVGFSRLQEKTEDWYRKNLPQMTSENYFLPSSELIIYWASGGIIGLLVFLLHILLPFFIRHLRSNVWFMTFYIPAILSFMYETHLEGQLPLFAYAFFAACFWHIASKENY